MTQTTPTATNRPSRATEFAVILALIVTIGLVIRLVFALSRPDPELVSDPTFFRLQGALLAKGWGFADPFPWSTQQRITPSAFHPPLFSMFLAGAHLLGMESVAAARVATCLLGSTTVLLVGLVGRSVGGRRVGLIGATIAAITPNLWVHDGVMASETLAATMVAAMLWFAYRLLRHPNFRTAIGLGLTIALAGLTRPETLALSVILVIPLAARLTVPYRTRVGLVVVAALVTIITIAPWMIRSATIFDRPVLFSTNGAAVIGYANCPSTYAGPYLGSWLTVCALENDELNLAHVDPRRDESVQSYARAQQGLRYLERHQGEFLTKVVWARIGRTWSLFHPFPIGDPGQNEGKTRSQLVAGALILWASMALALVGVLKRPRTVPIWPLLAPLVVTTIISVLAYGTPRFRVIAEPSIAILAALGIDLILRRSLDRGGSEAEPAASVVSATT